MYNIVKTIYQTFYSLPTQTNVETSIKNYFNYININYDVIKKSVSMKCQKVAEEFLNTYHRK